MAKEGVVAFAFGVPATILSNRRIAEIASEKARELGAPVYTQLDVIIEAGIEVERVEERPGEPPPTLRIAREAVQWAKRRGLSRIWLVAAVPHRWRARRDIEYAFREAKIKIEIRSCSEVDDYPVDEWFCSDSTQPRTRSRKSWELREIILIALPMFLYKIVAS